MKYRDDEPTRGKMSPMAVALEMTNNKIGDLELTRHHWFKYKRTSKHSTMRDKRK